MKEEGCQRKLQKNLARVFALSFFFLLALPLIQATWWDGQWALKQALTINASPTTEQNYSVKINLNTTNVGPSWDWTNECSQNQSRLRVINGSENQVLNYWIEMCDTSAKTMTLWVKIPENITSTGEQIYLYYGNQNIAPSTGNASAVFQYYFNFSTLTMISEGSSQDASGVGVISEGGRVFHTGLNSWKVFTNLGSFPTLLSTGRQILEVWMHSSDCGEIQALNFDTDNVQNDANNYKWCGTQSYGRTPEKAYTTLNLWTLVYAVLNDFTITPTYVHIAADDDGGVSSDATYKDLRIRKYQSTEPQVNLGSQEAINTTVVALQAPENGTSTAQTTITFNCSVATSNGSQLSSVTLYHNISGVWQANETNTVSGQTNETSFTIGVPATTANYIWNCEVQDNYSRTDMYDENYTLKIDLDPPSITINNPSGTIADVTPILNVSFSKLVSAWYNIDGQTNITLCTNCSTAADKYALLPEGSYTLNIYANDTLANNNTAQSIFTIDMQKNYYDSFEDNSSIAQFNSILWTAGKLEFSGLSSTYTHGILTGIQSTNMNFIANQWGGSSPNAGEVDITCPGGDASCYFITPNGTTISGLDISNGVTTLDSDSTTTGWIMYSVEDIHTRMTDGSPHADNSNNFVAVCYTAGQWYYDDNNGCDKTFTPVSTDIIVANLSWGISSVTALTGMSTSGTDNITSHEINVSQNIIDITNITWTEINTDANNNISVELSVDGGTTWHNATQGQAIENISTEQGAASGNHSLKYRVYFTSNGTYTIGLDDMNISWDYISTGAPQVELLAPANQSKQFGNGTISFSWNITDDEATLNCSLYINDSLFLTAACSTLTPIEYNTTLPSGHYNWTVQVNDSQNNTVNSSTFSFYVIHEYAYNIERALQSSTANDLYLSNSTIKNLLTNTTNQTRQTLAFVDTSFVDGSHTPTFNQSFAISNQPYQGEILVWNQSFEAGEEREISYALAGLPSNYSLRRVLPFGFE
ncbi:MAG: DUF2341 domain-containing protein [Candidatus Woesearchaeota archaeon]|nr:MAG: DUF2341 domain-containing protein [Candidatus Woesearchaeota archaeon]